MSSDGERALASCQGIVFMIPHRGRDAFMVSNRFPLIMKKKSAFLLIAVIIVSIIPTFVSGSTYPPQPIVSVSVENKTIDPGSGLGISVEWDPGAAGSFSPQTIHIALYNNSDGSLLGTYTIPKTGQKGGGVIQFRETIPDSILPAGHVVVIATDPVSGAYAREEVNIITAGEFYQAYRNRQVMEGAFYPVAAGLIIILAIVLGILVLKRT
jgi:hypothetical protein